MDIFSAVLCILLFSPRLALAYIGPGAGFAFFTSFSTFFIIIVLAFLIVVTWPIRYLYLKLRYGARKNKRVIILGLDGLDPELATAFMEEGHLKNFQKLRDKGSFSELRTTCPALSPVAWSAFITGAGPGRHNIFDFLAPDRNSYMPVLSSSKIRDTQKRLHIGKYALPLGKPKIQGLRKGKPFWKVLGEKGYSSSIIRVPITFPPEKFRGRLLSAMCVPDILGTQGTFSFYTTESKKAEKTEGGRVTKVSIENGKIKASIIGPQNSFLKKRTDTSIAFSVVIKEQTAILKISNQTIELKVKEYSQWVELEFPMLLNIKVKAICRFLLTSLKPDFGLYVTPIQINPESPALPISYPSSYSLYFSLAQGVYSTLGLAEDTWGLNERVLDEDDFIKQAYLIHNEREKMFFREIDKVKTGVCACVFDITDRIQHMFFKYHAGEKGKYENVISKHREGEEPSVPHICGEKSKYKNVILKLYQDMDEMLGRVMEATNEEDLLMVISDHGFKSFERGVNLNSWLFANGYLSLKKSEKKSGEWFEDVDWSKTKAYALGLGGIFINKKNRERLGIVSQKESTALCCEIQEKLKGLMDTERNKKAILNVYQARDIYNGPYVENAPEIIVGFNKTYRVSWESAKGVVNDIIIEDNTKNWSGDHCIDPSLVPGVFFSNRRLKTKSPHIMDIGPTVLHEFGVKVPTFMEGKALDLSDEGE